MKPGVDIRTLERALESLIKEWDKFFAGVRRTPPQIERTRLERRLRLFDDEALRGAERFRLQQLQHRFSTYSQMWERMLREREEGRGRSASMLRAAARASEPSPPAPSRPEPNAARAASVSDGGADDLFKRFVDAKREVGQTVRVDADAFAAQIGKQREQLEARLGYKVQFDVVVDGDKVKLAARRAATRGDAE